MHRTSFNPHRSPAPRGKEAATVTMRPLFRFASLLLALLFVLVYFGAGAEGVIGHSPEVRGEISPTTGCAASVTLTASDPFDWSTSVINDVCATTTFIVTNDGSNQHTFTVSPLVNQTASTAGFFEAPNPAFYQASPTTWLNASVTLSITLTFPSSGAYEFTCIPHFGEGMHGEIYVEETYTAPATASSPSFEPFWYIVGIVGTLAVLAVVGGLVYGKAGAESSALKPGGPVTSYPEYFNDSRPDPMDSAEPMKRGGDGAH